MSYLWIFLFASLAIEAKAQGFDLSDALDDDGPTKAPIPKVPEDPKKPDNDPEPKKPAVNPPKDGGTDGGSFDNSDLTDLIGGDSGYKPDKGKGGGYVHDPSSDYDGGRGSDDGQKKEAGSINMTAILSSVGVAIFGAISSYVAYKKKRLCFGQGGNQRGGGLNIGGLRGRGGYGGRGNHPAGGAGGGGGAAGVISSLLRMV